MKRSILISISAVLFLAFTAWAYFCTRPFTMSGPIGFGTTVPEKVKPIIEGDISSRRIDVSAARDFSLEQYFRYLLFQDKVNIVSPLALTFENTPDQVTVGDGRRRYEYVLRDGAWTVWKHEAQGLTPINQ
jgi:hypothetical protein